MNENQGPTVSELQELASRAATSLRAKLGDFTNATTSDDMIKVAAWFCIYANQPPVFDRAFVAALGLRWDEVAMGYPLLVRVPT